MYDDEVVIPVGLDVKATNLTDLKRQISEVKTRLNAAFEEKKTQVNPKSRSAASKAIQQQVSDLASQIIRLEELETRIANAERNVRAAKSVAESSQRDTRIDTREEATRKLEAAQERVNAAVRRGREIVEATKELEEDLARLRTRSAELQAKGKKRTDAENNEYEATLKGISVDNLLIAENKRLLIQEREREAVARSQVASATENLERVNQLAAQNERLNAAVEQERVNVEQMAKAWKLASKYQSEANAANAPGDQQRMSGAAQEALRLKELARENANESRREADAARERISELSGEKAAQQKVAEAARLTQSAEKELQRTIADVASEFERISSTPIHGQTDAIKSQITAVNGLRSEYDGLSQDVTGDAQSMASNTQQMTSTIQKMGESISQASVFEEKLRQIRSERGRYKGTDDEFTSELKGRSAKLQEDILAKRHEIEDLQRLKQQLSQRISQLDKTSDIQEIGKLKSQRSELAQQILDMRRDLNKLRAEQDAVTVATRESQEKIRAKDNFGGNFLSRRVYYNLRQIRLIQSEIDRLSNNTGKVEKALTSGLGKILRAVTSVTFAFTSLRKAVSKFAGATNKANKSQKRFSSGLVRGFWSLMKYAFGMRSALALTNRLRSALSKGMANLVQYSSYANNQMSSLATSLLYLKNTLAAFVQPFLNVVAPAVQYVTERFEELTFQISQLVASLTGQSFVYRAVRAQVDYAKSLSNSADQAERLGNELGKYDKLDVIKKDNDDAMPDPSEMFRTVEPISSFIDDLAKRIRDIGSSLLAPLKAAWDNVGKYVMDSLNGALNATWGLIKSIGRDFLTMWNESATVHMWESVYFTVGNILTSIENIALRLREAWDENNTGLRIWENLRDIVATLLIHIQNVSAYMTTWSSGLNFGSLLTSLEELLGSLRLVADFIGGVFEDIMERVVLKHLQFLIDEGLPLLNNALNQVINRFDWDGLRETLQPLWDAIEHLMDVSFEGLTLSIGYLGDSLAQFTESQTFNDFIDKISRFIQDIRAEDVQKLFDAVGEALIKVTRGFMRFINYPLVTGFLDLLISFVRNSSSSEIATVLVAIGGAIMEMKFIAFAGRGYLNCVEFFNILSAINVPTLMGVAGGIGSLAAELGLLVGALKEFEELTMQENYWDAVKDQDALPKIGTDANGASIEVHGLLGALIDLRNFLAEKFGLFGGETIAKSIIVESDVEKLERMRLEILDINADLEKRGKLTDEMREKMNSVYQMWYDNGEKFNGMNEEQVGVINSLYRSIREYYDGISNNSETIESTERLKVKMSELKIATPTREDSETKMQGFMQGIAEPVNNDVPKIAAKIGDLKNAAPTRQDGERSMREYTTGMGETLKAETTKMSELKIAEKYGEAVTAGVERGAKDSLEKSQPKNWFQSIIDGFKELFHINSPSRVFYDFGQYIMEGLKDGIEYSIRVVKDEMSKVKDAMMRPVDDIKQGWNEGMKSLEGVARNVFEGMEMAIKSPINGILSAIESLVNGVIEGFNGMADAISLFKFDLPDWLPDEWGGGRSFSLDLPKLNSIRLPRLAQGAVIPPNQEFLAMLGDQKQGTNIEAPLDTMVEAFKTALREENTGRQGQQIVLQLDGKAVARVVWDETDKRYKQTGQYVPCYA